VECVKFDRLILRKIIKILVTRCQILRLICTKFDFGYPTGGAHNAPPDPLAGFKGPTSKGRKGWGREGKGRNGRGGGRREGEGGKGEGLCILKIP